MNKYTIFDAVTQKTYRSDEKPPWLYAFSIGESPTVCFFQGKIVPITKLRKFGNILYVTLNKTKATGFMTYYTEAEFKRIASVFERDYKLDFEALKAGKVSPTAPIYNYKPLTPPVI